MKRLLFFVLIFSLVTSMAGAEIFLNSFPSDITINEGDDLIFPLLFSTPALAGKPIEIFIWEEGIFDQTKAYLGASGWIPFLDDSEMSPILSIPSMVGYAFIRQFQPFISTTGLSSLNLFICIDGIVDGRLSKSVSDENGSCGSLTVYVNPDSCTSSGLQLTPSSISETVGPKDSRTVQVQIVDSCGKEVENNATTQQTWIEVSTQQGLLTVNLNASALQPGSYSGLININSGEYNASLPVNLTVYSPDTTPPTVPSGLTVNAVSSNQLDLSWDASTDDKGIAEYKIYSDTAYIKSVTSSSASITGLSAATKYCFEVSAYDAAGNYSTLSEQACGTTLNAAPTGLTALASCSADCSITLSWDERAGISYFKIYRNGVYLTKVFPDGYLFSFTDYSISPSTRYCYRVSSASVKDYKESELSESVCVVSLPTTN